MGKKTPPDGGVRFEFEGYTLSNMRSTEAVMRQMPYNFASVHNPRQMRRSQEFRSMRKRFSRVGEPGTTGPYRLDPAATEERCRPPQCTMILCVGLALPATFSGVDARASAKLRSRDIFTTTGTRPASVLRGYFNFQTNGHFCICVV